MSAAQTRTIDRTYLEHGVEGCADLAFETETEDTVEHYVVSMKRLFSELFAHRYAHVLELCQQCLFVVMFR